jgi:hypothetical protein
MFKSNQKLSLFSPRHFIFYRIQILVPTGGFTEILQSNSITAAAPSSFFKNKKSPIASIEDFLLLRVQSSLQIRI